MSSLVGLSAMSDTLYYTGKLTGGSPFLASIFSIEVLRTSSSGKWKRLPNSSVERWYVRPPHRSRFLKFLISSLFFQSNTSALCLPSNLSATRVGTSVSVHKFCFRLFMSATENCRIEPTIVDKRVFFRNL